MLDVVINDLIEKLVESLVNEGCHVLEFQKQFKDLKKELLFVQSYIKDAEQVQVENRKETLKVIVQELRELLYDAEDIISDCELFLKPERRKMASKCVTICSLSFFKYRYQMGKKLGQINHEIRLLREKMRSYLPTTPIVLNKEQFGINRPVRYPVLMNNAELIGLDSDAEKIIQWALESRQPLNIIGIVGMGGIGKTTLALKIRNNANVNKFFDHVLMVTVSQTLKFEELIKNMLRKFDVVKDLVDIDVQGLLEELHNRLEGKRCFIILDDVWGIDEGSWWESLKSVLSPRNSCVIVTTRNEEVARSMGATDTRIHHPQLLSNEDSWSLFTKIAFLQEGGQCPNPELEYIGREIVAECQGLPLAIKVVGGMMQGTGCSINKWRQISENLKEELAKKGELIFSVLELSYKELPSHLKPCMLCLVVLPEDYKISSYNMILWWIGEGFVRGDDRRTAYEIGKEYIDELISRCLLLCEVIDPIERRLKPFRVHDTVRDMMRRIAKEENFICFDDRGRLSCTRSRRVGMVRIADMNLFAEINFKSMRTIVGTDIVEIEMSPLNLGLKIGQLKWLRVLSISFEYSSQPSAADWLNGIGSLQHLVCLMIRKSGMDRLPDSIGNLHSLQILHLSLCPNLKRLPKSVASLEKLSILNIFDCKSLECLPMEIGNLSNLQQLWGFKATNSRDVTDGFCISELKKLSQLRSLYLDIDSEDAIEEGDLKVLSELKQLRKLVLVFGRGGNQRLLARKVNHELSPLQQLLELSLYLYPEETTPVWLNPTSLPNLHSLIIFGGNITHMSGEFFQSNGDDKKVWKLEALVLYNLFQLEEEWPSMQRAMPYLRLLEVVGSRKLKSLPCDMNEDGRGTWRRQ